MKMRYLVIASVSVLLLFSSFAYGSIYDVFSDVKDPYSYYYGPVYAMSKRGVINGYEDGRFGPDDNMTRAQVATLLYRYDEKVVWPLVEQVSKLHEKGWKELHGASWEEYLQNYRYYRVEFTSGGEGSYGSGILDFIGDAIAGKDSTIKVVYENLYELANQEFGMRIIQIGDGSLGADGNDANFVIWQNDEMFGERVYGEFTDDIGRLITEAEAAEQSPEKRSSDGLWTF